MEKKDIFKLIGSKLAIIFPYEAIKVSKKIGEVVFYLKDNKKVIFSWESVNGGAYGKGSFRIVFDMGIFNPLIANIRDLSFGVKIDEKKSTYGMVLGTSYYNGGVPEDIDLEKRYTYISTDDIETFADIIVEDIQKYYFIMLEPFLFNYELLLQNYKDPFFLKKISCRWSFKYGVIVSFLIDREDYIEDYLVPLVKTCVLKDQFLEFDNSSDYKNELVIPIKKYMEKNNLIGGSK